MTARSPKAHLGIEALSRLEAVGSPSETTWRKFRGSGRGLGYSAALAEYRRLERQKGSKR